MLTVAEKNDIKTRTLVLQLWVSALERHGGRYPTVGAKKCICCKQNVTTYTMTKFLNTASAAYLVVCADCHKINNDSTNRYTWALVLKQFGLGSRADGMRSTAEIFADVRYGQIDRIRRKQEKLGIVCPFLGDIGCTLSTFEQHLEKQFVPGMTWKNHNTWGWHIDHIRSLSKVDVSNADDINAALHYTNLQPMWAKDNLEKMLFERGFAC